VLTDHLVAAENSRKRPSDAYCADAHEVTQFWQVRSRPKSLASLSTKYPDSESPVRVDYYGNVLDDQ